MKKYRLIKEYPASDSLGTIITGSKETMYSKGLGFRHYDWAHVETHPEYWEEVVELDYEVTQVLYATEIRFAIYGEYRISRQGLGFSLKYLLDSGGKIYSVKRLSDGEIFTVGDKITGYHEDARSIQTIRICTYTGRIRLEQSGGCTDFMHATKVKQPIFLTHDGKDIFAGDKVWWVRKDSTSIIGRLIVPPGEKFNSDITAYFLTEEAAQDYIKRNKVLFTTEDGKDIFEGDKIWYVNKESLDFDHFTTHANVTFRSDINAYFLTREEAEEYIQRNKPRLSIEDCFKILQKSFLYGNGFEKEIEKYVRKNNK